jgi:hypothetical protein
MVDPVMFLSHFENEYRKVASTSPSCLEAHAGFFILSMKWKFDINTRGCQIGMQGPQFCAKPCNFCKLDVATSRIAFLDLNLHSLQVATSNSKN